MKNVDKLNESQIKILQDMCRGVELAAMAFGQVPIMVYHGDGLQCIKELLLDDVYYLEVFGYIKGCNLLDKGRKFVESIEEEGYIP